MNRRNAAKRWAMAIVAACSVTAPAWAEFNLVDDFEAMALGPIDGQGAWTAEDTTSVVALDPAVWTNQVLAVTTESTHLYRSLMLEDGTVRMVFLRFRFAEQLNASWGLSDHVHPYRFDHFDVELGLDNADGDLRINDGGTFDVLATLHPDRWYNCWILVDNASDETQVWLHSRMADSANSGDQLSSDGQTVFLFRSIAGGDLVTFFIKTGGGSGLAGPLFIDDIYLEDTDSTNLDNPCSPPPAEVDRLDRGTLFWSGISPNPSHGHVEIDMAIPGGEDPVLGVFDPVGRRLASLHAEAVSGGEWRALWNGRNEGGHLVPAGVYYVRVRAGEAVRIHRIVRLD